MMEFFRTDSRSTAYIRDAKLKNKKLKQSKDAATEKVIEMSVAITITKEIREKLDKRLKPLVIAAESEANEELPINSIDLTEEYEANVNLFNAQNFSGLKPNVKIGQDSGRPAKVRLTKIAVKEKEAFLVLKITAVFIDDLWLWIPKVFADSEFVIELMPHQGELDFDGAEEETEEAEEKPKKPKVSKKKKGKKVSSAAKKTFQPEKRVRSAIPNV